MGGRWGTTWSFLSAAAVACFSFAFSKILFTEQQQACLATKKQKTKKQEKNFFNNLLRIDTTFISQPLLRKHWDSRQQQPLTPAGNALAAVQAANRCAEGGTFRRHPCICTLNPISAFAWCVVKRFPQRFPHLASDTGQ